MISTLAYRSKLSSEKNAGLNRFSGSRGRVLSGFGGDLAGYNTNLIKSRAAQEDQLIQKKYDRGEISFDELMAHLNKAANREWLSTEEKQLLKSEVQDLKVKYEDEQVAKEYQSGRMKAADVATYQRSKLATMLPGNPVYENQLSEIAKWEKEDKVNRAKEYIAKEEARIAGISDQNDAYSNQSSAYRQAANLFRQAGDTMTAYQYDEAANAADVNKQAYEVKSAKTTAEEGKNDLVDSINTAYNEYHDGTIDAQTFLSQLDGFERLAITGKYTDLLDNMNKLTDYVREDVVYGKDWSRGGNRIKGPGVGTGGYSVDPITGEISGSGGSSSGGGSYTGTTGGGISGVSGVKTTTGSVTNTGEKQTWAQQDEAYKANFAQANQEILDGKISKEEYVQSVQDMVNARKMDLEQRVVDIESSGASKVLYNGSKTNVKTVLNDINTELNNNWGKILGLSEAEVGSAGINDMATALTGDMANVVNNLDLTISQDKNVVGADFKAQLSTKNPLSTGYVTDSLGRMYKIKSQKFEDILTFDDYSKLISSNPERAMDYTSKDGQTFVKKDAKLYVDIPSSNGESARYLLNEKGDVLGMEPNLKDTTKYTQYLPEGKQLSDYLKTPTSIRPLQDVINEATTAAQTEKNRPAITPMATPEGQIQPIQDQTFKGPSYAETIKNNIIEPISKIVAPQKAINVPAPANAGQQFADKFVNPLSPSKIIQPPKQIPTQVVPNSIQGPLQKNQVRQQDLWAQKPMTYTPPKTPAPVQQPKPNIIQQATSWISNLFKPKKR